MKLTFLEALPPICDQAGSELCFFLSEDGTLLVVYEARRDFLSTPRSFIEVSAQLDADKILCTGGLLLDSHEYEHLSGEDFGVYEVVDDDPRFRPQPTNSGESNALRRFLFYSPTTLLECYATSLTVKKTHYHHSSSRALLAQMLQNFDVRVN